MINIVLLGLMVMLHLQIYSATPRPKVCLLFTLPMDLILYHPISICVFFLTLDSYFSRIWLLKKLDFRQMLLINLWSNVYQEQTAH